MTDQNQEIAEMREGRRRRREAGETFKGVYAQRKSVIEAEDKASQERRGLITDTAVGAARAVPGAFEEAFDLIATIDEELGKKFGKIDFSVFDGDGIGFDPFVEGEDQSPFRHVESGLGQLKNIVPDTERWTGAVAEPIGKFIIGFVSGKKILQGANLLQGVGRGAQIANAVAAGAISDVAVFDGHEERLSNMIESVPALQNPVTEWLAADEDDSELEGRIKGALEGGGVGLLFDSLMVGLRGIRAWRRNKAIEKAVEEADKHKVKLVDELPVKEGDEFTSNADGTFTRTSDGQVFDSKAAADDVADPFDDIKTEAPSDGAKGGDNSFLFTADDAAGKQAGILEVNVRNDGTLRVLNAEVDQSLRGQGNGNKLYDEAVELARAEGKTLTSDSSVSENAARNYESLERRGAKITDQRKTNPDNVETKEVNTFDGAEGVAPTGKRTQFVTKDGSPLIVVDELPPPREVRPSVKKADADAPKKTEEEIVIEQKADTQSRVKETMQITEEQARAFRQAMADGDEDAASEVLKDFNENNIDWSKIEDADDIKQVLLTTEKVFADLIDDAKGGVQSNKQTRMLANLVNATPKEIGNLFRDTRGGGGIAARFYAAQRTMLASAQEVKRAAKESLENPGSSKHEADALRALQVHAAIQAEVKGAQTEIARALQGMSIIKDAAADNYREFDALRRQFAGSGTGKTAWEKQMDELLGMRDLDQLNAHVRMTGWEKFSNMFIEYTINSMLSSPKTHVINFVSNVLNTVLYTMDRGLGGSYRYLSKGDKQALREFRIDTWSKMSRLDEAWKLAKQAWRDGAPVTDKRQRIEFQTRMANSVEGTAREATDADATRRTIFGNEKPAKEHNSPIIARKTEVVRDQSGNVIKAIDHTVMERILNTLGRVVRIPGRALITGDEFFKAVNRNAEISVLAFRQADEEALAKGLAYGEDAYEKFLEKRIAKLSDTNIRDRENVKIQAKAIEKSRRVTFQEAPITSFGSKAESFVNSNRWFKLVVAPFFRTPMNILRQGAFDRTPLGYLFDNAKDIIKEGHPRDAAEIHARMFTGVAAMATFYGLVSAPDEGGAITVVGKVPFGTSAKDANVNDYSIKFGDGPYHQFNRLEPMGMWLGIIGDMKTAAMYTDDDDLVWTLSQGAIGAFMNNVGSKTYMKSLSDIQEMFEGVKTAQPATLERAMDRFISGELGKLIPQIVKSGAAALEGEDRFARETWDVIDTMMNRASLFNEDLPLQHDNLGRPKPRDGGLSVMFNPFTTSEDKLDDPVYKEMFRLGFTLQPMAKTLGAGAVELSAEEYSRMTGLVSKTGIHATLTALVTSEAWDNLTDPLKKSLMKARFNEARVAARGMFLATGDIMQRVADSKIDAASLLTSDSE